MAFCQGSQLMPRGISEGAGIARHNLVARKLSVGAVTDWGEKYTGIATVPDMESGTAYCAYLISNA
jgi:hypothetical protein